MALSQYENNRQMQVVETYNSDLLHRNKLAQNYRAMEQESQRDFLKRNNDMMEQRKTDNLRFNQESVQRAEQLRSDLQSQRDGHEKERNNILKEFQIGEDRMRMEREQNEKWKREEWQANIEARGNRSADDVKRAEAQLAHGRYRLFINPLSQDDQRELD